MNKNFLKRLLLMVIVLIMCFSLVACQAEPAPKLCQKCRDEATVNYAGGMYCQDCYDEMTANKNG